MIITVNGQVADGWTAIIKASSVTLAPVPAAASFSLSRTIDEATLVYVVVLEAATGDKLTGEVEVKAYSEAKPDETPENPPADKTPDEKVAEAKTAIQDLSPITIAKEKGVALDADGIKAKVKENIISAASAKGVTVTEAQIAIEITTEPVDGTDGDADGTPGVAKATVTLTLEDAADSSAEVTINITVPAYEAPSEG